MNKIKKLRLDIGGPKGNAFYILGLVKTLTGGDKELTKTIIRHMKRSDYDNLLHMFKSYFPNVELYSHFEISTISSELYVISNDVVEL